MKGTFFIAVCAVALLAALAEGTVVYSLAMTNFLNSPQCTAAPGATTPGCAEATCNVGASTLLPTRYKSADVTGGLNIPIPVEYSLEPAEKEANYVALIMYNVANPGEKLWFINDIPVSTTRIDRDIEKLALDSSPRVGKNHTPYKGPGKTAANYQIFVIPYIEKADGDLVNFATMDQLDILSFFRNRKVASDTLPVRLSTCCHRLCFRSAGAGTDLYLRNVKFSALNALPTISYTPNFGTTLKTCAPANVLAGCTETYELGQIVNVTAPAFVVDGKDRFAEWEFVTNQDRVSIISCGSGSLACVFRLDYENNAGEVSVRAKYTILDTLTFEKTGTGKATIDWYTVDGTTATLIKTCNETCTGKQTVVVPRGTTVRTSLGLQFGNSFTQVVTAVGAYCSLDAATHTCDQATSGDATITYQINPITADQTLTVNIVGCDGTDACARIEEVSEPVNGAAILNTTASNAAPATKKYISKQVVALKASPALVGYRFKGWGSTEQTCIGVGVCNVELSGTKAVTAIFVKRVTVTVVRDLGNNAVLSIPLTITYKSITGADLVNTQLQTNSTLMQTSVTVDKGTNVIIREVGKLPASTSIPTEPSLAPPGGATLLCTAASFSDAATDCNLNNVQSDSTLTIVGKENVIQAVTITINQLEAGKTGVVNVRAFAVKGGLKNRLDCTVGATTGCTGEAYQGTSLRILIQQATNSTFGKSLAEVTPKTIAVTGNAALNCNRAAGSTTLYICDATADITAPFTITLDARLRRRIYNFEPALTGKVRALIPPATAFVDVVGKTDMYLMPSTRVTFHALSTDNAGFTSWAGTGWACDNSKDVVCSFFVPKDSDAKTTVTVGFVAPAAANMPVDVYRVGAGTGNVKITPGKNAQVDCSGGNADCSASSTSADDFFLQPTATGPSYFLGWADELGVVATSGTCVGTGTCIGKAANRVGAYAAFAPLPGDSFFSTFVRPTGKATPASFGFYKSADKSTLVDCSYTTNNCTVAHSSTNIKSVNAWPGIADTAANQRIFNGWALSSGCSSPKTQFLSHCTIPNEAKPAAEVRPYVASDANARYLQIVIAGRGQGIVQGRNPDNLEVEAGNYAAANGAKSFLYCSNQSPLPDQTPNTNVYSCLRKFTVTSETADPTIYFFDARPVDSEGRTELTSVEEIGAATSDPKAVSCTGTRCTVRLRKRLTIMQVNFDLDCPDTLRQRKCDGTCIDVSENNLNCGGCGVTCPTAISTCKNNQCSCTALGLTFISGENVCINRFINDKYCGASLSACNPGQSCVRGVCSPGTTPNPLETNQFPDLKYEASAVGLFNDSTIFSLDISQLTHFEDNIVPDVGEAEEVIVTVRALEVPAGVNLQLTGAQGSSSRAETRDFSLVRDMPLNTTSPVVIRSSVRAKFQYIVENVPAAAITTRAPHQAGNVVKLRIDRTVVVAAPALFQWRFQNLADIAKNRPLATL
eukprot:CAMPEP_0177667996 /NCGR_PEP_ID=MMETSP0447-20121125/22468_1 /TAXON_ID=0 /ORGANISM="Stygamoeba regulata, Strain BSH-02190019" /LENGTH=1453 /DNA_ID=CAMNT_0019174359 /DNA_START=74 /DNA_END=4435 /DNA_ORIENTATION=-